MKIKLLLYCTKAKPYLVHHTEYCSLAPNEYIDYGYEFRKGNDLYENELNGKIVAECDYEVEEIEDRVSYFDSWFNEGHHTKTMRAKELIKKSCLDHIQLTEYLGEGDPNEVLGYAIHIKNLHIFDEPRELKDFDQVNNCCFEKEVDKDWEGLPIYACVFTNCCRYQSDGHTCDKHFYPLKRIHNMSKAFDNRDCKWKYVISLSPQEMCKVANKEQTALVRRDILKEMLK